MACISTVIITRNEAKNIYDCIRSAQTVSDDVVVVDCGSEDNTVALAEKAGATVVQVQWQCYGHSRNTGAAAATYDWILALDADERVSPELADYLQELSPEKNTVYAIKRTNYFAETPLRFGTPGFEKLTRLYHRHTAQWDLVPVHEKLQTSAKRKIIQTPILHYGIDGLQEHLQKKEWYAWLSAEKYRQQQKQATIVKRFLAPAFDGLKSYLFQAGFLDGKKGWQIASTITYYTWLKYHLLHQLNKEQAAQEKATLPTSVQPTSAVNPFFARRG